MKTNEQLMTEKKSRSKYQKGEMITDIQTLVSELDSKGVVFWRFKVLNKAFLQNWQLRIILNSIKLGVFCKALKVNND